MRANVVLIILMASKKIFQLKKSSSILGRRQSFNQIIVLGGNVLRSVNGWEMSHKVTNCKFSTKSFSGAKLKI